jgi:formylglycine-generating enzyme required for sulfatase activity
MSGTIEALKTRVAQVPTGAPEQAVLGTEIALKETEVVGVATALPTQESTITPTAVLPSTYTPTPIPTLTPIPTPTPGPVLGDIWSRRADGMVMVYVPAGKFEMGADDEGVDYAMELCRESRDDCERKWFAHEQPAHTVELDGFWIDRSEVTVGQYQRCVEAGVCEKPAGWTDKEMPELDLPVVNVSWFDAETYCKWAGARMPTEAQWEYAARGPESRVFPWGDEFDRTRLNYCNAGCESQYASREFSDGYGGIAPVGSFPTGNSWCGAWDMAGNVWEWVADWYAGDYYVYAPARNPTGPSSGEYRVLRGGSMSDVPYAVRSSHRYGYLPDDTDHAVGFRCASDSK